MKLIEVTALVHKDAVLAVPVVVWAHELPALRNEHGEDRIEVLGEREVEAPEDFNPGNEWLRLQRKYDRRELGGLHRVYPMGAAQIAQMAGVSPQAAKDEPQAVIRDGAGKPAQKSKAPAEKTAKSPADDVGKAA